jgi:endonuclease/exonuclease/phosphatase (EEP) superfamily protein YafD
MNPALKSFLHRRFRILTTVTAVCYVVSKIPVDHFFLDLLDHFQGYYFLWFALSLLSAVLYFKDKKLALSSVFFLAASLLATFVPLEQYITLSSGKSDKSSIKLVSANVLFSNNHYQDIEAMILEEDPDILAIPELSVDQQRVLGSFLGSHYPYQFVRPVNDASGIGLYSKFPLTSAKFFNPALDDFGYISASVRIHDKNYNLLAVHPFPPIFQSGFNSRNVVYHDLPFQLVQKSGDNIVIGDFNNTLWSPDFLQLMQSLKVKANLFAPATWPALTLVPKIGIDHILIPQNARFISMRRGANIGSDHYPLIAEIALP